VGAAMRFLFVMILLACSNAMAQTSTSDDLIGKWQAIGYFYQGTFIQPPDPQLTLTFEFFQDGSDILFWQRKGEKTFCERKGSWFVQNEILHDEIVWINPENGMDCGGDPDMELGRINESHFRRKDNQLFVDIPLADEYLTYVWDLKTEGAAADPAPVSVP
jgi:hypothetical protein